MRTLAICSIALFTFSAFARIVPRKDPVDGVLDAQLVVIVQSSPVPGAFRIDEVFLGDVKQGDSINLGDFQLSIVRESGAPAIEPITPDTRILLFLQRKKDSPTLWEPTVFSSSYFWVQRPHEVALLRRAAERAVDLRRRWEDAAHLSDPKQRVRALWPFLAATTYGVIFFEHTEAELEKARPASGEHLAEQLDSMSHSDRMWLLGAAGNFGSEKLHNQLRKLLEEQKSSYERFVESSRKIPKGADWNTMPEKTKDSAGELYYGLTGLAAFRDPNDLPFIRETAVWSSRFHLEQVAAAAVIAFGEMPDRGNLPAISSVLKEFLPGRVQGMWSVDVDAERSLCKHQYQETIPLLAPFLQDDSNGGEAEYCLAQIVGRDLGRTPKAWTDWYATARNTSSINRTTP